MTESKLRVLLLFSDQLFAHLPERLTGNGAGVQEETFRRALRHMNVEGAVITAYQEFHPNTIAANDLIVVTSAVPTGRDQDGMFTAGAVATLRFVWKFRGAIIPVAFDLYPVDPAANREVVISRFDDPWSWVQRGSGPYGCVNINPIVEDVAEAIRREASTWQRSSS